MGRDLDVGCEIAGCAACDLQERACKAQGERRESDEDAVSFMIQGACNGLSITDEQLRAELEAGGDLPLTYNPEH